MSPRRIRGKKFYSKYGIKPPEPKINIAKEVWSAVLFPLIFAPIIALILFWSTVSDNKLRQRIAENPAYCPGIIIHNVTTGRGAHYATYRFNLADKSIDGKTLHGYLGSVGDTVQIIYNLNNPEKNIIADEAAEESLNEVTKHQVIPITFILSGALFIYITLIWFLARKQTDKGNR